MTREAFVDLVCPACEATWTEKPHDLPPVDEDWTCPHCEDTRHLSEFMKTATDLEVVTEFHREHP